MSFQSLKADELRVLASEGFAVEVPEGANKPQITALLTENGVTWEQAVASPFIPERFLPVVPEVVEPAPAVTVQPALVSSEDTLPEVEPARGAVVTSAQIKGEPAVAVVPVEVVTAPPVITAQTNLPDTVLLKMNRDNPRYDVRGYKFTREHPFALVDSTNAEFIVENVEGFVYATPKEAREFYG